MQGIIERLDWDSTFFGYEVGKTNIIDPEKFDFASFDTTKEHFKLIYVYSPKDINLNRFRLVDRKVVFMRSLMAKQEHSLPKDVTIQKLSSYKLSEKNYSCLFDLALESGIYSRFKIDENFVNNEYEKLYTEWIRTSISGKNAFEVIIALKGDELLGFVTLAKKDNLTAEIGLIAVSRSSRGLGLGKALINAAFNIFFDKNLQIIQVVTQKNNAPAMALYSSLNFKIEEITNIYHFWNL